MPIVTPPAAFSLLESDPNNRQALETLNRAVEANPESKFVHKYLNEVSSQMLSSGATE